MAFFWAFLWTVLDLLQTSLFSCFFGAVLAVLMFCLGFRLCAEVGRNAEW